MFCKVKISANRFYYRFFNILSSLTGKNRLNSIKQKECKQKLLNFITSDHPNTNSEKFNIFANYLQLNCVIQTIIQINNV